VNTVTSPRYGRDGLCVVGGRHSGRTVFFSLRRCQAKCLQVPRSRPLGRRGPDRPVSPRGSLCYGARCGSRRHLEVTSPAGVTWPWDITPPRGGPASPYQPTGTSPHRATSSCLTFRAFPLRCTRMAPPGDNLCLPPSLRRSRPAPAVTQPRRHANHDLPTSRVEATAHGCLRHPSRPQRDGCKGVGRRQGTTCCIWHGSTSPGARPRPGGRGGGWRPGIRGCFLPGRALPRQATLQGVDPRLRATYGR